MDKKIAAISRVAKYSGEGSVVSLRQWLREFENVCDLMKVSDEEKAKLVGLTIDGTAKMVVANLEMQAAAQNASPTWSVSECYRQCVENSVHRTAVGRRHADPRGSF